MFRIQTFTLAAKVLPVNTFRKMSSVKRQYVKEFCECAICGAQDNLEVHHVKPVHLYPELACDPSNFITLCDANNNSCHKWFGHFGNFTSKYNPFIREYAVSSRLFIERYDKDRRFIVLTNDMIKHFADSSNTSMDHFIAKTKNVCNVEYFV